MGEDGAHDHRRHDATRRGDERHVPKPVGAPLAEERMACEEVDGVDLAGQSTGSIFRRLPCGGLPQAPSTFELTGA